MNKRTFSLTLITCALLSASISWAGPISVGINFVGNGNGPGNGNTTTLTSATLAGVVPVSNYNNITGSSGTNVALVDNTNAAAGTLTFSGGGTYTTSATAPVGGDEILNAGDVFGTTTGTVTLPAGFAAGGYNVYLYTENDGGGRPTTTSVTPLAGSPTTYYYSQIAGGAAGQVDGSGGYTYLHATNTNSSDFTQVANYALFTGLTTLSFSFSTAATGNGAISGIEIVAITPEPSSLILCGLGAVGLLVAARRRRKA